ncbi:1-acyl-sn-glycerol-3-phosphate acyltransferase gamma-like [Scaptodrosophila lebanonensis]|uniref:1-acyl-sn-glycerol-3-phosphate acyltransferase gamma-like n=1 Tax=Drosophila lebanonensis TaxID=7225 RepID=A0A6J2TGE4_DROLE|nr:1-acyl-sn-glycerol-3-phosphate acyltransferase gamma-like [Scaptodrosophila lebanonensis]XP_030375070.1 1-acyl-sn-glycerol-3-phosphate acyltransferase gamma-like [Scaptodrosophila lebanonensis]XP_030375071.1 1-acyl-sn-glycerol-3-phosphate acyltransferase gamma-like [Scaptodrosophila lebanonensis]XP_030375072.1 1-acyl-sn-glycerol-3-phosphate acyltransferase gamma-like [Scaptodrosophila lebanonensis]XP_030375073.1 1-acyl-sn-glycerol-3-phosphate acyltransferase gamma-like [Scaptodrosophila leba
MVSVDDLKKLRLSHLCIAITFFTCGLAVNFAQLLLHIFVKPVNKTLFRKLMYYVCYSFYCQLVFVADWYANGKMRVYMDAEEEKKYGGQEHVLLIMNHSYEIDWLAGWMLADKLGVLGNCKAYAKKVISYVPVIGWAWKLAEFVFLERNFDKDKEIIANQLKVVYSYPDPIWLLLNAEGTRFTATKHEASVKFAQERGMTVLKHHLIPRTKGFTASLPSLRGICPVVYDINLAFKRDAKVPPTMLSLLNGQPVEPYMFVRRIPLDDVPDGEQAAAAWLQNLFVEKDRIIDSFHETGSFFKTSGFKEVQCKIYDRRLSTLLNFFGWATVSISLILYYLLTSLLAQNWTGLITGLSILLIFYMLMEKAINMSKISKASSYGATTTKTSTK